MAMGDENAVEFGQCANFTAACRAGAVFQTELLQLNGKVPRTTFCAGIIQDDFGALEVEPAGVNASGLYVASHVAPRSCVAGSRLDKLIKAYASYNMVLNHEKVVRRATSGGLWGGHFNGLNGHLRAPPQRVCALVAITLQHQSLDTLVVGAKARHGGNMGHKTVGACG